MESYLIPPSSKREQKNMGVVKLLSTASSSPQLGTDSQTPLMVERFIEGTAVVAPGFTKVSSSRSSSHNFQKRLMARQRGGNISSCNNSSCHLQARQEGLGSLLQARSLDGTCKEKEQCLPCQVVCLAWPNCFCGLEHGNPFWEWHGAVVAPFMGGM